MDLRVNNSNTKKRTHDVANKKSDNVGEQDLSDLMLQREYDSMLQETRLTDDTTFINLHSMTIREFEEVLSIVGPSLRQTAWKTVSPGECLSVTLQYLTSGENMLFINLDSHFLEKSTICKLVHHTCSNLWICLRSLVFPKYTKEMWKKTAARFQTSWSFPHCMGAIDGRLISIENNTNRTCRKNSVLFYAVSDINYRFIIADICLTDENNSRTIFKRSSIGKALLTGAKRFDLPPPAILPKTNKTAPYSFIGNKNFPLLPNLLRPLTKQQMKSPLHIEQTLFNFRYFCINHIVDSAFNIFKTKWGVYKNPILASDKTALAVVRATVVLHNWLVADPQSHYFSMDTNKGITERARGRFASAVQHIPEANWKHTSNQMRFSKNTLIKYYNEVNA